MKNLLQNFALTGAILLLVGCSVGLRNEALQSCLDKARGECSATVLDRCEDKTGASKASCQKTTMKGCSAAAEKSCKKLHQDTEFENGNGGGGY